MRIAALMVALALPALAAEQLGTPAGRAAHRKKAPPRPWEALLESSRAALDASRSRAATAVAVRPSAPALTLPPAQAELPLPLPQSVPAAAAPAPADLPLAAPAPRAPAPATEQRPATSGAIAPADDAPDLVSRPRRVLMPSAPESVVVPAPVPEPAALVAEPPPQPAAPASNAAIAGMGGSVAGGLGISPAAALPPPSTAGDLNFDLLDKPDAPSEALLDPLLEAHMSTRRTMLTMHQSVGIGLVGLMAGTMVTGQLNYLDRFGGGASNARYEQPHLYLATTTMITFGAAGLLAFFAPVPLERHSEGLDRATLHKLGMIGATVGMVAEGTLGILTAHNEGMAGQSTLAQAHLGIGYFTLLCMSVGVGALVF